ncbi:MAG: hypothetical protein ACI8UP_004990 [Porticoccaceae bacterium]|jgi:hypothetical protein
MTTINPITLDKQIDRFGLWSAVVLVAAIIISLFIPLDVPGGYGAEHADRVEWLTENRGLFILGWINQIVAMLSLSAVFFGIAWHITEKNPLRAILAALAILLSVVAFIIPKFIAVWTIPQLATAAATGAVGADMANQLLVILNVSIPFSLYTSFDYLGFWLYAVFGLLVAGPLYNEDMSSKVAAVTAGLFGIAFHGLLAALLLGVLQSPEIEASFSWVFILLIILVVAMLLRFRDRLKLQS